jgi:two-component system, OmpR family, alkaline phosphatase synthesis response regulator PhoP
MRILLVEDEESLRKVIQMNLTIEGYEVVSTDDGRKAMEIIENQHFDLLLLDIMLPNLNGHQICEQVRLSNSEVGIIFISAKDTSSDRIEGLRLGADDYLVKPFSLEELLLRVQAVIKRTTQVQGNEQDTSFHFDKYSINFKTFEADTNQGRVTLTNKEVQLLKLLIDRKNQVVSRQMILQTVWGYDVYPSTRTIDNFILYFRKYFEKDPKNPTYFHSIRGVGYKFTLGV